MIELLFAMPGLGRILIEAALRRDPGVLGSSAAVFVWLALLSRFLGNLLLAWVDRNTSSTTEAIRGRESGRALAIGAGVTLGLLLLLFLVPFLASQDPVTQDFRELLVGPSASHFFGTDRFGRDMFSRVVHGGRTAAVIGLPMGLLALLISIPMMMARVVLDRAHNPALAYWIDGVLEGLVAVPWLLIGILIQGNLGGGWPFVALTVILVPRALRVGWALGVGERLQVIHVAHTALRLGALFLAATLAMSTALGFLGLGVPPPRVDLGAMLAEGRQYLSVASWIAIIPGIVLSLITATWLVVAALFSRSGPVYRAVRWIHIMS